MKWLPWFRPEQERAKEKNETERVRARLRMVMEDLHQTLDKAEQALEKGMKP